MLRPVLTQCRALRIPYAVKSTPMSVKATLRDSKSLKVAFTDIHNPDKAVFQQ